MSVLVDTSALLEMLDASASQHTAVVEAWSRVARAQGLVTHDRVVTEASALVQRRLGMRAAEVLHRELLPAVGSLGVTSALRERATERWLRTGRRGLSLVDVTSFVVMEAHGLTQALALDDDFVRAGFEVLPTAT